MIDVETGTAPALLSHFTLTDKIVWRLMFFKLNLNAFVNFHVSLQRFVTFLAIINH